MESRCRDDGKDGSRMSLPKQSNEEGEILSGSAVFDQNVTRVRASDSSYEGSVWPPAGLSTCRSYEIPYLNRGFLATLELTRDRGALAVLPAISYCERRSALCEKQKPWSAPRRLARTIWRLS